MRPWLTHCRLSRTLSNFWRSTQVHLPLLLRITHPLSLHECSLGLLSVCCRQFLFLSLISLSFIWLCILGMIGLWTWMCYSKVGYGQPISSFLCSLRTDFSSNTDSVSCQWRDSHGPWGTSRLLVVDSLLWTAIEHRVINFWTKKKKRHSQRSVWQCDIHVSVLCSGRVFQL